MGKLEGKIAVVTGGNSGIGLATAERFVAEGAYVFITGRRRAELDRAAAQIGRNVTAVQGDVTRMEDLDRLAATVRAEKGRVDVIVSSAGVTEQGTIDAMTPEHFDRVFDLNGRAPVFLVNRLLPLMTGKGSIVLVGSGMHLLGYPGHTAYAATKAALRSYVRTWAAEFRDRGIRANTLSPGPIDTPMLAAQAAGLGDHETVMAHYRSLVPMARLGDAEEVASAALFLASDESSYMTGSDLMVDGGIAQV